jgi:hypothetical protein
MNKINQKEFLERAIKYHGDKYNYSLVEYIDMRTKVKIICPIHGIFEQNANDHIRGSGCHKCHYENFYKKAGKTLENFIKEANKIHNKYDYSKVKYKGNKIKICIICPIHGEFWQTPNGHLRGRGCQECGLDKDKLRIEKINNDRHLDNKINFVKKCNEVHNNLYEYLSEYINIDEKIVIKCKKCNYIFKQLLSAHLSGNGCPKCNKSKGELLIESYLMKYRINYKPQYNFENCRGKKRPLPFDFYLPDYNTCIEFDGRQHFEPVPFNGSNLIKAKERFIKTKNYDKIRNQYCGENNIRLIRISYKDNIKEKLEESLCHLKNL